MALTVEQAYAIMDMLGLVWGHLWFALDSVYIVTVGANSYSFLDVFLIASAVVDIAWEILDEVRA